MIRLYKDWYLDTDKYNYILCKKVIARGGASAGEERFEQHSYYGDLKLLKKSLLNKAILADVTLLENIDRVIDLIEQMENNIENEKHRFVLVNDNEE